MILFVFIVKSQLGRGRVVRPRERRALSEGPGWRGALLRPGWFGRRDHVSRGTDPGPVVCPRSGCGGGHSPVSGLIAAPRSRSSKCRCGPEDLPVEPDRPDPHTAGEALPQTHVDAGEVRVHGDHVQTVADRHGLPVAAGVPARERHAATSRAATTGTPVGAGKSRPVCMPAPRGPKRSPSGAATGRRNRSGLTGRGRRSAAIVPGPAAPSAERPAKAWKRWIAACERGPYPPSIGPDGKPRVAARYWTAATSQPRLGTTMTRAPSAGRPLGPRAARVAGPATPSATSPLRA